MSQTLLRGRTLSFLRWPDNTDDHAAYRYEEDGGLLIDGGKIVAAGSYAEVSAKAAEGAQAHRPPAASHPAGLHRRACAFPADAGDRLLRDANCSTG